MQTRAAATPNGQTATYRPFNNNAAHRTVIPPYAVPVDSLMGVNDGR